LGKFFRNYGTYLIQVHYILVSFYDFSLYDPVLLEPNPVVKQVLFWSRFTTSFYDPVLLEPNPVVKRVLPVVKRDLTLRGCVLKYEMRMHRHCHLFIKISSLVLELLLTCLFFSKFAMPYRLHINATETWIMAWASSWEDFGTAGSQDAFPWPGLESRIPIPVH
jgi:hypothetical protein